MRILPDQPTLDIELDEDEDNVLLIQYREGAKQEVIVIGVVNIPVVVAALKETVSGHFGPEDYD